MQTSTFASSLQDIVFTNSSLGYCAGTFGKVLYTTDCGLNWQAVDNTIIGAQIEEMWFCQ